MLPHVLSIEVVRGCRILISGALEWVRKGEGGLEGREGVTGLSCLGFHAYSAMLPAKIYLHKFSARDLISVPVGIATRPESVDMTPRQKLIAFFKEK